MPARRIRLEVDGVAAVGELLDDLSPQMAEAFWQSLPVETTVSHAMWSGAACYYDTGESPMRAVRELEYPVCSIYPGTVVARPGGGEIMVSYGAAEYRSAVGTDYLTPIAKLVENRKDFLNMLSRVHDEGDKPLKIRQEG
jgi:hypothetical protein